MTHLQQHSATTLARELTAATGLHFRPNWQSDPIQAVYGEHDDGLLWQCNIGRWSGQDPWVICKGHGLPVKALAYKMGEENARGRGWQSRAARGDRGASERAATGVLVAIRGSTPPQAGALNV